MHRHGSRDASRPRAPEGKLQWLLVVLVGVGVGATLYTFKHSADWDAINGVRPQRKVWRADLAAEVAAWPEEKASMQRRPQGHFPAEHPASTTQPPLGNESESEALYTRWRDRTDRAQDLFSYHKRWQEQVLECGCTYPRHFFEPYLVWSDRHQAYVSNATQSELFWARFGKFVKRARTLASDSLARVMLDAMHRVGLPPILHAGSLLAFIRQGELKTDDFDFKVFPRFFPDTIDKYVDLDVPLRPRNLTIFGWEDRPKTRIKKATRHRKIIRQIRVPGSKQRMWFDEFGVPGEFGYELGVSVNWTKFELFMCVEEEDSYWTGLWVRGKLYRCKLPGPTAFAPAVDVLSGARFWIPTSTFLELEYFYGLSWDIPYDSSAHNNTWYWATSVKNFSSCDMKNHVTSVDVSSMMPMSRASWDFALNPLAAAEQGGSNQSASTADVHGEPQDRRGRARVQSEDLAFLFADSVATAYLNGQLSGNLVQSLAVRPQSLAAR